MRDRSRMVVLDMKTLRKDEEMSAQEFSDLFKLEYLDRLKEAINA